MSTVKVSEFFSLTIANQTVHTVYAQRNLTLSMVHLVNVTAAPKTVNVYFVPALGAAAAANAALLAYVIPANDFIEFGEGQILSSQQFVVASCSVDNAVNMTLCGLEE
jgi:hypothetical protein